MRNVYNQTIALMFLLGTFSNGVIGIPRFTKEPPSVLYVSSGGTARLVWDYNTKNRSALFDPYSPEWAFYNSNGARTTIGLEDGYNGHKFVIQKKCPARLRGRVSKESTATLVISNVTTADSGIYGCDLILLFGSPVRSIVQLTVTDRPRFTTTVNATTHVTVGSNLSIQCVALASPMPNVTWVSLMERPRLISAGVGEAFLRFNNITREQSGTYECQATNNPNEDPVTIRTNIFAVKKPAAPANISVSTNSTSALITWLSPRDDGGTPIIEYKIKINTSPPREFLIETTYYVIENLKENMTYTVKVYARNQVGYGKAKITEFTTKDTATSKAVVNIRGDKRTYLTCQTMYFFQGRTFAIVHLTITSALVAIIFILISCFYMKFENTCFKDNRKETKRFTCDVLAQSTDEDPNAVALTTIEHAQSDTNNDSAENVSPTKDYEILPEKSESSTDSGNAIQETRMARFQFSHPHHEYQELNTDVLMSNSQTGYQTLNRNLEDNVTNKETDLRISKYEALKFVNPPQRTEYQKLHLYASIGDKK